VVEKDERDESGLRAVLNFGHTFGHAFEALSWQARDEGEAVVSGQWSVVSDQKADAANPKSEIRIRNLRPPTTSPWPLLPIPRPSPLAPRPSSLSCTARRWLSA